LWPISAGKKSWENPKKIRVAPPQNEFFMGNLKKIGFLGGVSLSLTWRPPGF
jgi:hypothetical protein